MNEDGVTVGDAGWRNEAFQEDNKGKMFVFFHATQVKHHFRTAQEKRPVFIERINIKKIIPGDTRLVIDRPMRDTDMEEFPVEWARYEQKKTAVAAGTPLEAWPIISDTQRAEFRALNIFTIDQFANLSDGAGTQIMGFNDLRAKAQQFLNASKDSELLEKVRSEADARAQAQDAEMAALKAQIAELMAAKTSGEAPKRTRRTKEQMAADAAVIAKAIHPVETQEVV